MKLARLPKPALPEIALGACMIGLAILTAVVADGDRVPGNRQPTRWWEWILVVLPAVPVAFRRVAPLGATAATIAGQLVLWGTGLANAFFAPVVMIYTVCAEAGERGKRLGIGSGAALVAMTIIGVFVAPDVSPDLVVLVALSVALAAILGIRAAEAREAEVALAEQVTIARVERDAVRERAVEDERRRIARELHDSVGHALSVIAVRAEAADRVAAKNPDAAVDAVRDIATTARASLADVRRVLTGLRDTTDSADRGGAELAPLPSLDSIPRLIDSFVEAGLAVELEGDVPSNDSVGAAVGAGAYRIVQEALTNALKHGGDGVSVAVRLLFEDGRLSVSVEDDGLGPEPFGAQADGIGLPGMRERAEVLGGSFESGSRPGGGFRVRARLPVDRSSAMSGRA